jgi:hypothetical protein
MLKKSLILLSILTFTLWSLTDLFHFKKEPILPQSMHVKIEMRDKVEFEATTPYLSRGKEGFEFTTTPPWLQDLIQGTVEKTASLIDPLFFPEEVRIILEREVLVHHKDFSEQVPASLVLSGQIPPQNAIRLGLFEIGDDIAAIRSILAHEMGHMIMEWVARKSGKASESDFVLPFWSKAIYEGVADFAAVCVTGDTLVGSRNGWFQRDILQFSELSEVPPPSVQKIREGFVAHSLIPQFRTYVNWLAAIEDYFQGSGSREPYAEGTWIAGQLWRMSSSCNDRIIWQTITSIAAEGKDLRDSKEFLRLVREKFSPPS